MSKPRLLDLCCKQGGASKGYDLAGFDVTGVDSEPQPRYPFEFHQADMFEFLSENGHKFDAIVASPPCQGYSRMRHLPWFKDRVYPMLIEQTRDALTALGKPWVIENVEGAPLIGITLCGTMFGLKVYRHRLFESSHLLLQPPHTVHGRGINDRAIGSNAEGWVPTMRGKGTRINGLRGNPEICIVAGHFSDMDRAKAAMGIDWMNRDGLSQAIPPAYTKFIGDQLMDHF